MNRNVEAQIKRMPECKMPRSIFDLSHMLTTSFGAGRLAPIYVEDVMPGDTFTMDTGLVCRLKYPFIKPIMDQLYLDTYFFFVPNRLLWKHWKEFMGENNTTYWTPTTTYSVPYITVASGSEYQEISIGTYLGVQQEVSGIKVSQLYTRAYIKIWNEFFRSETSDTPIPFDDGDTNITTSNSTYQVQSGWAGLQHVNKLGDYFTTALPEPQKGTPAKIPLASSAPVKGTGKVLGLTDGTYEVGLLNTSTGLKTSTSGTQGMNIGTSGSAYTPASSTLWGVTTDGTKSGLIADLSSAAGTINALIEAYAIQKLMYLEGVGGTRYIEIIDTFFGVKSSDARLQRPEYLGGKRIPLNTYQVVQNSSTDTTSAQGNITAFGYAQDYDHMFSKSFEEHGIIMGLACVRYKHSYQQGIHKRFSRFNKYDFYWPPLANLCEQPIYRKELFATGVSSNDDQVFGYQEAYGEYKQRYNMVTGPMRSSTNTGYSSDDEYHFADYYTASAPPVYTQFITENTSGIQRTLAVPATAYTDLFMLNIGFNVKATRPMPAYSVPGFTRFA